MERISVPSREIMKQFMYDLNIGGIIGEDGTYIVETTSPVIASRISKYLEDHNNYVQRQIDA